MNVIAVIPARGGSKSIPLKNIKPLNGKPLIEYTIESAIKSKVFDRIVVSTDSEDIRNISLKYAEIDVIDRPDDLSLDESKTEFALIHACNRLKALYEIDIDIVVTLEPTSPFRTSDTIGKFVQMMRENNHDSLIGVTRTTDTMGRIVEGRYELLFPDQASRRQDREPLYVIGGGIYATKYKALTETNSVMGGKTYPYILEDKMESIDINYDYDFFVCESVLKNIRNKYCNSKIR